MPIRITGMNSGLDTESIIKQLVSAYSVKKDNYVKAQTSLSWKQDAWKSLNSKIYSLKTSLDSLRFTAGYTMKTASVSDSTKATVKAGASAVSGSYTLKVAETAKSGYLTGGKLASGTTTATTLKDLGYTSGNSTISVTSGGKTSNIAVDDSTTIKDFVAKLNETGVKASFDAANSRIYVASSDTGVANDFSITGSTSSGTAALTALGLNARSDAGTAKYAEWAAYAKNSDGEDYFTFNANGTTTTNGVYDAGKTQSALQQYLDAVAAAEEDNDAKKIAKNESSATISEYNKRIAYAQEYAKTQNVLQNLTSEEQRTDLKTLTSLSDSALQKSYEQDENGNLLYDPVGELIEANEDSLYSTKGSDLLKSLQRDAGLVTQKAKQQAVVEDGEPVLDEEGNPVYENALDEDGNVIYEDVIDDEGNKVIDSRAAAAFKSSLKAVTSYESDAVINEEKAAKVAEIHDAYTADPENGLTDKIQEYKDIVTGEQENIKSNNEDIAANDATIKKYSLLSNGDDAAALEARINYAVGVTAGTESIAYSEGATRVNGQDAVIYLNDAMYTSSSSTFEINGLTIEALSKTGDEAVTITTKPDTQGVYDKVKAFLKQYNELMAEMTKLFSADSAKGYKPLTAEEKDAMTDTEVEEWEKKIKDSLLRRDGTLDGVMSVMKSAMSKSYEINGKKYSLSSFGISTLGILKAEKNEEGVYHIDGDKEDTITGSKTDKLMDAITKDPDSVVEFMKSLTEGLYQEMDKKMKGTTLKTVNNVYNDKQMGKEYSSYTTTIKKWEEKVAKIEETYYKKFAAMEKALATLQSNTSSLTSMFGGGS